MTKVEILAGMRTDEEPATRLLLGTLTLIDVDDPIVERAGALGSSRRR